MDEAMLSIITHELALQSKQVKATVRLFEEGATVPFISRYRKEATGSLDEVAVLAIRDRLEQLIELQKRRTTILETIEGQGLLTSELKDKIVSAETLSLLEDLYLPFKPKRRTRGTIAKEKGLEPLANLIYSQVDFDPLLEAKEYIDRDQGVNSPEDALLGCRDIIAEWISEHQDAREQLRHLYHTAGMFECAVASKKEAEAIKFKDYFDWQESVAKAPSHRVLAMRRGAKEKLLSLRVTVDQSRAIAILESILIYDTNEASAQMKLAIADCFKRLLSLSMETEIRLATKQRADDAAITVFGDNLKGLLMSAPLGQIKVMALDPGFRTGCKLVCLDATGALVHHDTIYPHTGQHKAIEAGETVKHLVGKYDIKCIAVGNGTAGRETEAFLTKLSLAKEITIIMVSENGASIYSASEVAREEFGEYDLTVRGAVSIGRRLMDPLAELVKIDPKSIGVGQYQHDVDQNKLKKRLDDIVESCVNSVGVDVNCASKQLLTYVSGVGPRLAERIVTYRNTNGAFDNRNTIKKVSGLGDKAFEQCAGFLRIRGGDNPLDASAVHPESYAICKQMASDLEVSSDNLIGNTQLHSRINLNNYVTEAIGMPTLRDIILELGKPGRDPRQLFEVFKFSDQINDISDVTEGMVVPGIVTNVTAFGAFVDIGVHQDGLVHISELSNTYVSDPAEVVKVQQQVKVKVLQVDKERKRIGLSIKQTQEVAAKKPNNKKKRSHKPSLPKKPAIDVNRSLASQIEL